MRVDEATMRFGTALFAVKKAELPKRAERKTVTPARDRRSFHGRLSRELSPVQRVIRENDRYWGRDLVTVGMQVAVARALGRPKRAAELVAGVRARRRDAVMRIADELRAVATSRSQLAEHVTDELRHSFPTMRKVRASSIPQE
jgi:hypothetical protein